MYIRFFQLHIITVSLVSVQVCLRADAVIKIEWCGMLLIATSHYFLFIYFCLRGIEKLVVISSNYTFSFLLKCRCFISTAETEGEKKNSFALLLN